MQPLLRDSVLLDWHDEDSVKILKKCREAIGSSSNESAGKVMIIDIVLNNHGGANMATKEQLLYDAAMFTYLNGKVGDEKEWASMFADAGFSSYNITLSEVYPLLV
ncbi:probable O-methyltransferase 3 [Salvia miltiorrhiza]|uniref:probable O-methyltransferase 3 n=1 Tax=Salvia miltiorrhiza TaxID=226208 RepID=UPI0025AC92A3|nr:probable O-methyltransferase 3 [Salvia miltiorrhiza]